MKRIEKVAGTSFYKHPPSNTLGDFVRKEDDISVYKTTGVILKEPDNPYDPQALKVIIKRPDGSSYHLGYVAKSRSLKSFYKTITQPTLVNVTIYDYSAVGLYNSYTIELKGNSFWNVWNIIHLVFYS